MYIYEYDQDEYKDYCEEYANRHPIKELGQIVGYTYPNGTVRLCDDESKITVEKY